MSGFSPQFQTLAGAHHFRIDQQIINLISGNQNFQRDGQDLILRLNAIPDASHTRDRKTSPPDSECFPGTREEVVEEITSWAEAMDLAVTEEGMTESTPSANGTVVVYMTIPHVYWLHGFAGCGKSAISLKIANVCEGSGRLLGSYFFFRNAGDRSTMHRFAVTLASQLLTALPATRPLIEAALNGDPGLLNRCVSLTRQLERLVYKPFQDVMKGELLEGALTTGPYIIVIDGLDECEDRRGVEEFIDHMLDFFQRNPAIPLRIFIASRIEQHIRVRLEVDGVRLGNLDTRSPRKDIDRFLQASFQTVIKKDRVIQAYIRTRGEWPTKRDMVKLRNHIGDSFVLAATIFKYIVQPATEDDASTPMDRLPLALEMNGLDGLYAQTLSRSQHIPRFREIISAIALLWEPLPIVGLADLLSIEAFEVVRVLLNLQAIFHVPGTDEEGEVTVCHTSLRDFLTTSGRSGRFFVPPSFHLHLSYDCFSSIFGNRGALSYGYGKEHLNYHWRSFAQSDTCGFIDEIEQLKARQPQHVDRPSYHAFLCNMLFYSLVWGLSSSLDGSLYLPTECSKQLVLATESPDRRIKLWLEEHFSYRSPENFVHTVQLTEHTYKTVQQNLQRASNAIQAKFPEILQRRPSSTRAEKEFVINRHGSSGMDIFNALEWVTAQAQSKWEEVKITLRPPLAISMYYWSSNFKITFDGPREIS